MIIYIKQRKISNQTDNERALNASKQEIIHLKQVRKSSFIYFGQIKVNTLVLCNNLHLENGTNDQRQS